MNRLLTGMLVLALGSGTAVAQQATDTTGQHSHDHAAAQAAAPSDVATPQTEGEIRKVDTAAQKLTVKHGRIENLGMSPMTMVFRVKDPAFLTLVKPGDKVKMTVERVDGVLTIVALQRVP
jgi:Cu(I)/Ag(I) efflux system periplasmic protein CusF